MNTQIKGFISNTAKAVATVFFFQGISGIEFKTKQGIDGESAIDALYNALESQDFEASNFEKFGNILNENFVSVERL